MPRIRRVESERDLERTVDEFVTKGYRIDDEGQYSTKVKQKDWGSVPVHAFVFLFTFIAAAVVFDAAGVDAAGVWIVTILANVAYAGFSFVTAEEIVIKIDSDER